MTDRITTSCQHSHTVTLRLEEGEWPGYLEAVWDGPEEEFYAYTIDGWWPKVDGNRVPPHVQREITAALAAAEASCGGCGCAERLRAHGRRYSNWHDLAAANFLDAAPDARGSDLRGEQGPPRISDLSGVYQAASEPRTTMDDWLAARHDDQEATDG